MWRSIAMIRLIASCLLALLVCGQSLASQEERKPEPPRASPRGEGAKPWRWIDPDRKPFADWHTDTELQAKVLADSGARVRELLGVAPPAGIEITITPA